MNDPFMSMFKVQDSGFAEPIDISQKWEKKPTLIILIPLTIDNPSK